MALHELSQNLEQERTDNMTDSNGADVVNNLNRRMRYTRQSIVTNTFLQMPRFLMAGEFAGNGIGRTAEHER